LILLIGNVKQEVNTVVMLGLLQKSFSVNNKSEIK